MKQTESILNWYPFKRGSSLLEIAEADSSLKELWTRLEVSFLTVSSREFSMWERADSAEQYDYIVCLEALETAEDPAAFVKKLLSFLKAEGTALIGADNRFGIRYFCGYPEKHSGIPYQGINGYYEGLSDPIPDFWRRTDSGRSFGRKELDGILKTAEAVQYKYYYPVPDLRFPQMICTDGEAPYGEIRERLNDYDYESPLMSGLEHRMFDEITYARAMAFLSNSFLVEITGTGKLFNAEFVMVTADRGPRYGAATILTDSGLVQRRALHPEGEEGLKALAENTKELAARGVPVVPCTIGEGPDGVFLEMPRIRAERLTAALDRFAVSDKERFMNVFDRICDCICRSFAEGPDGFGRVYLDLAPCNAFLLPGDELLFFDQEFTAPHSSCAFGIYRSVKYYFASSVTARQRIDMAEVLGRYGIGLKETEILEEEEKQFIEAVRNVSANDGLYEASRPDLAQIARNAEKLMEGARPPKQEKAYKRGYVPGVFDLFHTGHLRLIERCKARCEYLIVGVLTDELVEYYKKEKPVIPLRDRMAVIAGLKAVDEVIPVDFRNTDKLDAWEQLHYDCHFSGDDHKAHWRDVEEKLKERGAAMEFFSYTEGISTTEIKETLKKRSQGV